jgi:hypothetical protein
MMSAIKFRPDRISGINQQLPLRLTERTAVNESVDLIDEGAELIAGRDH